MSALIAAITGTFFLVEVAGMFVGSIVYVIMVELGASKAWIYGAEGVVILGLIIASVVLFRYILAIENRIAAATAAAETGR